jgi:hypothetical protein
MKLFDLSANAYELVSLARFNTFVCLVAKRALDKGIQEVNLWNNKIGKYLSRGKSILPRKFEDIELLPEFMGRATFPLPPFHYKVSPCDLVCNSRSSNHD